MNNLPNFSLLLSFVVLSEELNFKKAAERLNLDQSALTRRIQKLEDAIGAKLLERTTKDANLTPAGQAFVRRIKPIIKDCQAAISATQMISGGDTGSLRLAYMSFAAYQLMPESVAKFRKTHSDIEITLKLLSSEQQKKAFSMQQLDVSFMYGKYHHSDYHCKTLTKEPLCLVAQKSHPLMQMERIEPFHLTNETLILGTMDMWRDYRMSIKKLYKLHGIEMTIGMEASNTLAIIGFVASGLGVTIYPQSLTEMIRHDNLAVSPIYGEGFTCETTLVYPRKHNNPVIQQFVDSL